MQLDAPETASLLAGLDRLQRLNSLGVGDKVRLNAVHERYNPELQGLGVGIVTEILGRGVVVVSWVGADHPVVMPIHVVNLETGADK